MNHQINSNQRVAILVDSANIFISSLEMGVRVDYSKILGRLNTREIVRAIVYHVETDAARQAAFVRTIRKMGYEVKTKKVKIYDNGRKKADWDVGMAIDAVHLADKVDVICILSGDGDFVPLVDHLKSRGVKVEAMAFERCTSRDLKQAVDEFYPITKDMLLKPARTNVNQAA